MRLLGVSASGLVDGRTRQLVLFPADGAWDEVNAAVDDIRDRFGDGVIGPGVE